jgi:hypothetical protein
MAKLITEFGDIICEAVQEGIAINPVSPPKLCDPIRRTKQEIEIWWRRPFVTHSGDKWNVLCLQQSGYEPSLWGTYLSLDDAIREANAVDPVRKPSTNSWDMDF